MSKSIIAGVANGRVQKKAERKERKRSGNNLYGSKGKQKCGNCRLARRACEFKSAGEDCKVCARKGLICGSKTRRGGPQDTVRLSVLKQLLGEHPYWLLSQAIAHLEGEDDIKSEGQEDVKVEPPSSCSPPPIRFDIPNGCDMIPSSSCSTTFSPFDFMGQPSSAPSTISLESLTSPGISPSLLKRELSQSCTPEFDYPYLLSDPPQWPFRPNAAAAPPIQPIFFNPESQFNISMWPLLREADYGDQ